MEEALKILQEMDVLLGKINYLGRKIAFIDDEVRNRAYTDAETMEEESIEKEREEFKVKFNECQKKLALAIETPENARQLKTMLKRKKAESKRRENNLDLYIIWVKIAEEKITEKDKDERDR